MNRCNYQRMLDQTIDDITAQGIVPRLLLHSCCAPCSSYVLEYLSQFFSITVFYYNPNIYPPEEYALRVAEQSAFIEKLPVRHRVSFIEGVYDTTRFYEVAKGFETEPECGERCYKCYELRLAEAGKLAKEKNFDYFTTTLSISPLKNAEKLNEIGGRIGEQLGINYLYSDFKKKNGYQRSTQLSKEYDMYRQNYCGCVYSYQEMLKRENKEKGD
ncbi:MAG: epoxyqueuosine reductase QueH [bacterium]|nr:epoxyqueuosine reductase QueH [bacterium]